MLSAYSLALRGKRESSHALQRAAVSLDPFAIYEGGWKFP